MRRIFIIVVLVALCFCSMERKISDINMLLPVSHSSKERIVRHNLTAFNGCYRWESSHPHIVEIEEIPNSPGSECSDVAFVHAVPSLKPSNQTVWITARDSISNMIVKCDVWVGWVSKLSLYTNYQQISVEEINRIKVNAYDASGSTFTSVEGLWFKWEITNQQSKESLWMIQPSETPLLASWASLDMEQHGLQTDIAFIKGVETGTALVKAKLLEDGYEGVQETSTPISVI